VRGRAISGVEELTPGAEWQLPAVGLVRRRLRPVGAHAVQEHAAEPSPFRLRKEDLDIRPFRLRQRKPDAKSVSTQDPLSGDSRAVSQVVLTVHRRRKTADKRRPDRDH
jgi:hypothetical protein